jgi:hypothetical protein
MADRGQYILKRSTRGRMVEDFAAGGEWNRPTRGTLTKTPLVLDLLFPAMTREKAIKPIAERIAQTRRYCIRLIGSDGRAPSAAPEHDQAGRMTADLVPGDGARAFFGTKPSLAQNAAKVRVSGAIRSQNNDLRAVFNCYL